MIAVTKPVQWFSFFCGFKLAWEIFEWNRKSDWNLSTERANKSRALIDPFVFCLRLIERWDRTKIVSVKQNSILFIVELISRLHLCQAHKIQNGQNSTNSQPIPKCGCVLCEHKNCMHDEEFIRKLYRQKTQTTWEKWGEESMKRAKRQIKKP